LSQPRHVPAGTLAEAKKFEWWAVHRHTPFQISRWQIIEPMPYPAARYSTSHAITPMTAAFVVESVFSGCSLFYVMRNCSLLFGRLRFRIRLLDSNTATALHSGVLPAHPLQGRAQQRCVICVRWAVGSLERPERAVDQVLLDPDDHT
jgi:hypothetical protein